MLLALILGMGTPPHCGCFTAPVGRIQVKDPTSGTQVRSNPGSQRLRFAPDYCSHGIVVKGKEVFRQKNGRHCCRPASGGRREGDPTLIAVFVLPASSCSCVPADAAGVPA